MQMAVLEHYPNVPVKYSFINRNSDMKLNFPAFEWLSKNIKDFSNIKLKSEEYEFLKSKCPYLSEEYLEYLKRFEFNPNEDIELYFVIETNDQLQFGSEGSKSTTKQYISSKNVSNATDDIKSSSGNIELTVNGLWHSVILYEIPLLSLISEAYFKFVDTDWNMDNQAQNFRDKAMQMLSAGCIFSEFGTRRRRSFKVHDLIINELSQISKLSAKQSLLVEASSSTAADAPAYGKVLGTSNVYLAKKYDLMPSGTVGHEWTMGIAALENTFATGNKLALYKWHASFKGKLGIALTDTFGIKSFFENFDYFLSNNYVGIRHDSGNPLNLIESAINHYKSLNIDYKNKQIVFSDSLNTSSAIQLNKICCKSGIGCAFGIGTFFTNDFKKASHPSSKSPAMNIVIKLVECGGIGCVKLSDDPGKHTGIKSDINRALLELGLK
ncbi:putative nicotinate phosphoribosyltransferase [Smittium culicis]|uniref:Nicotinate phosphoribosyltransferase n=1 Tax=Smittium culicis TaxID=133412 RepID=A0A1R1XVH7_9FUNG|nr:putative nicotinate phosphoribosyltransferase [Smittium culicis]